MCAVEALIPGASTIAKAIEMGKKIADKLGVMGKIMELKRKAYKFVVGKFLNVFGCRLRRRLWGFKKIGRIFHHVVHNVSKTVHKVSHDIAKKAKKVGKTLKVVA